MIINMVGGGGSFSPNNALLGITAYTGSDITITNGTITKTVGADRSHVLETDATYSIYYFGISSGLFSDSIPWDIAVVKDGVTTTAFVIINDNLFYNIKINYLIPFEYQQVTYLKGFGPQYIDTLISTNDISKINAKIMMETNSGVYGAFSIFGGSSRSKPSLGETTLSNGGFVLFSNVISTESSGTAFRFGINNNDSYFTQHVTTNESQKIYKDTVMTFQLNAYSSSKYSKLQNFSRSFSNNIWNGVTTSNSLYLFATHYSDGALLSGVNYNINRIYSFEIFNRNNEKSANLIPCYRKSDNVAGMYDNVNNRFLVNQGTYNFMVGEDVI